jgi:hypothetical protein
VDCELVVVVVGNGRLGAGGVGAMAPHPRYGEVGGADGWEWVVAYAGGWVLGGGLWWVDCELVVVVVGTGRRGAGGVGAMAPHPRYGEGGIEDGLSGETGDG